MFQGIASRRRDLQVAVGSNSSYVAETERYNV